MPIGRLDMLTLLTLVCAATAVIAKPTKKPNIVLILTDDQDVGTLRKPEWLPRIHEYLIGEGVLYDNFFAPVSVCCPSRVSLLRTQLAHNHNISFVTPPWGGWEVFNKYGYVGETLPDSLQAAGYNTYYTGKYMNHHTEHNCETLPVSGFNSSDILVDPYTYDYWNPGFSRDNGPVKVHAGEYSTDLVAGKALDYLDQALNEDKPFFLGIAPVACHSWISKIYIDLEGFSSTIPAAHPRHQRLFPVEQLPRTESFNPDEPQGVSWVKSLPKLNSTQEAYLDEFFRGRLRSLQPVDELVEDVVKKLEAAGELDNTYIFYTADNGYALGTHRRQPGKTLGYEEDIHVPLIVRGPGVKQGHRDTVSSYGIVDLSRTILEVAGAQTPYINDGVKINLHQTVPRDELSSTHQLARHSISEYWVLGVEEGVWGGRLRENNTYRTLRVHDEGHGHPVTYSYSVWCTGERELYDLTTDPHQVRNILAPLNDLGEFLDFDTKDKHGKHVLSHSHQRLLGRLDGLLLVLKTCKGDVCHKPYQTLFPPDNFATTGEISSLSAALSGRFDDFFRRLPRVRFSQCALGYQSRFELPEWKNDLAYREGGNSAFLIQQGF